MQATKRNDRGGIAMYVKTMAIIAALVTIYCLLVFVATEWWQALPLSIALGLAVVAVGFNIMHDANHEAYSSRPWVNRLLGLSLDVVGGSSYFWRWKHNVFHHTFANVIGYDTDINLAGLGRLTPHHPRAPIHRWQHLYAWFLYGVMVVKWQLFDDFRLLFTQRMAGHYCPRPRGWDLTGLIAGKVGFYSLAFVLPLLLHPFATVAAFYLVAAVVTGSVLGAVFQLAHCVEQARFPLESEPGRMAAPWAVHQIETTVDFARDSRVLTWLLGGLNFQIEHHLFPRMCHVNYPTIAPVIEQTCKDYGVDYKQNETLFSALRSHYRWLRAMGRSDSGLETAAR